MNQSQQKHIRQAAVLGAGVMGAQIAAHLVNAGIPTYLFELSAHGKNKNANTQAAIKRLRKLKPSPLACKAVADRIVPCNYAQHLERLSSCELVVEAIAERMDWKQSLYAQVAPHIKADAIFASNTSGLSINALAAVLPADLRPRFCGVHFFNPPRYMHLAELIPSTDTRQEVLAQLEAFLTSDLGKGVVIARDTPNFIGNRIGVFSMLATLHHTEQYKLGFDVVDALTGPAIGRPKSATFRTADVVGLDTFAHVVSTMADTLPEDPWRTHFHTPDWLNKLIKNGALGQKTGAGLYRKKAKAIQVLDRNSGQYTDLDNTVAEEVQAILSQRDPAERMRQLHDCKHIQAQFLWSMFRDLFHYCAVQLESIADCARDVDLAMRWGYGWKSGPFESWQAAGWSQVLDWIREDVQAGHAMSSAPLPAWVDQCGDGVHHGEGSFAPATGRFLPPSQLSVYERQIFPLRVLGESGKNPRSDGDTVFESDDMRCWHQGDGVLISSFKTKMNCVGIGVLDGLERAVREAEDHFQALVIWQPGPHFSVGADLKAAGLALKEGRSDEVLQLVTRFQQATGALKYAMVPTVAAVRGMALGGGCEIVMHCAAVVAALESYLGLVEIGVGLLPAGGGLKELALRCVSDAKGTDSFPHLQRYFEQVAKATVSSSAAHARELGYLRPADQIIFHERELLYVAKRKALAMAGCGYRPPMPGIRIPAGGDIAIASLRMLLENMREGRFISDHDYAIATRIAQVMAGGDVDRGSPVDEDWLLRLEREHFIALAETKKTQERIAHMLKTGKPLRN